MPTKPLPKPASKTALNKKYQFLAIETKGRLDITTEKGRDNIDLLQTYYNAFSNLYGAIILSDAWYLFKMAEEDITKKRHIIKKDFYAFSEVARYEDHDYFVLEIDELYEEEKSNGAATRFIFNKKLYSKGYARSADYYWLAEEQYKHPLRILNSEELLSWAQPGFLWCSNEGAALKQFIESLIVDSKSETVDINGEKIAGKRLKDFIFWHKTDTDFYKYITRAWEKKAFEEQQNVVESEKILSSIERYINIPIGYIDFNDKLKYIFDDLEEVGVRITELQLKTFVKLFMDFSNNSRRWPLSGWKPIELHSPYTSDAKPAISFGKNMQKAFDDGTLNKNEIIEGIKKLGLSVIE